MLQVLGTLRRDGLDPPRPLPAVPPSPPRLQLSRVSSFSLSPADDLLAWPGPGSSVPPCDGLDPPPPQHGPPHHYPNYYCQVYEAHVAEVKRVVPKGRLLVFNPRRALPALLIPPPPAWVPAS